MGFEIDASDFGKMSAKMKGINIRATADESMQDILENEFVPYLISTIKSKGLIGEGPDKGEGPHLGSEAAWVVQRRGNMDYRIYPDPSVQERAFYLEYGTTGPITPNNSETLAFESTEGSTAGDMIYPVAVSGVKDYAYFRESIQKFGLKRRLINRVEEDLKDHIRDNLHI